MTNNIIWKRHHFTVMQRLKPGKYQMYAILEYNDFQNLRRYLVSNPNIDILSIYNCSFVLKSMMFSIKVKKTKLWEAQVVRFWRFDRSPCIWSYYTYLERALQFSPLKMTRIFYGRGQGG